VTSSSPSGLSADNEIATVRHDRMIGAASVRLSHLIVRLARFRMVADSDPRRPDHLEFAEGVRGAYHQGRSGDARTTTSEERETPQALFAEQQAKLEEALCKPTGEPRRSDVWLLPSNRRIGRDERLEHWLRVNRRATARFVSQAPVSPCQAAVGPDKPSQIGTNFRSHGGPAHPASRRHLWMRADTLMGMLRS
jgi:hypothetical protein